MNQTSSTGRWIAIGVVSAVVALVILALVREPTSLDPETPQGVVQAYLNAIASNDLDSAQSHIDVDEDQLCDGFYRSDFDFNAHLGDVSINGDTATVQVEIEESYGMFNGSNMFTERFRLVRIDGTWKIRAGESWPYIFERCG